MDHPARLAIDGAAPLLPEGPPAWPRGDERVRAALLEAYASGAWGKYHGGYVERLEAELAQLHGVAHALTCASGTFAVELALRGLKIGEADEVVLAGYDFPGNFRAIEAVGARPVLVDIEPRTWCLDANELTQAITERTTAIIVSHLHGGLADMAALRDVCDRRGVKIVEDACQAPGAMVQGKIAGSWGDVGVLSFGGSKLLTAGRGGAIITGDPQIAQRAKIFCERGNHAFPLAELQAAVLLPQLASLAEQNDARRASADLLRTGTASSVRLTPVDGGALGDATYYKFAWLYQQADAWPRERFIAAVRAEGVAMDAGFRGFAGRSASRCRSVGSLSHAAAAAEQTVLLHHPVLLEPQSTVQHVVDAIYRVLQKS